MNFFYYRKKRFYVLKSLVILISILSNQAFAADVYVKASAVGLSAPFDGSSWDHPLIGYAGLKTAFEGGNDVFVAAGMYTLTSSLSKSGRQYFSITGGFPANAKGTDKSGYNPVNNVTTLDGVDTYKIFGGTDGVNDFKAKGLVFTRSTGGASAGGVYCAAGGPALQRVSFSDCIFKNNKTTAGYGGVAYFASITDNASFIHFVNCVFDGNQSAHHGGALGFSTVYSNSNANTGAFLIDGCSFVNNRNDGTGDDEGGAIYFTTSHGWTIRNSNFCSNTATLRGGALVFTTSQNNVITNSSFSSNGISPAGNADGDGGAIYVTTGQVSISGSTFLRNTTNNTIANLGGAVFGTTAFIDFTDTDFIENFGGGGGAVYGTTTSFQISNSRFFNNIGLVGGGLMSTTWRSGIASNITNSVFYGNSATSTGAAQDAGRWGGGALCLDANANRFNIVNTKFVNNSVPGVGWGGAISIYDLEVHIDQSLFFNNTKGGSATVNGSDLKNYNDAGDFFITNTKVQLANAAAYTNQLTSTPPRYGFGVGNTFSNTDDGGVTNITADPLTCPVNIVFNDPFVTLPDLNVTYINVPVSGNVSTNDIYPTGTTYGTPVADGSNPAGGGAITMNPDGTYTFTGTIPGVYVYEVPVCIPGGGTPCPTETLTITVVEKTGVNPPVANPDYVSGSGSATGAAPPITSVVKANDAPGNTGGLLGVPTITSAAPPASVGTIAVVGEDIVFTPATGFYGEYEATYEVCETPGGLCATATVTFLVNGPGSINTTTAADDFVTTPKNMAVSGNVKTNDTDAEGDSQTVTAQTGVSVSGKGTLDLAADGSFTFTPEPGFVGPVEFTYQICDDGSPSACNSATLYILVLDPFLTVPDFNVTQINVPVPGNVSTNDTYPTGTTYDTPVPGGANPAGGGTITMNPDGTYTFTGTIPGVYVYEVPVCAPDAGTPCPTETLTITVLEQGGVNPPVANPDYANGSGSATGAAPPITAVVKANDAPGNTGGALGVPSITSAAPLASVGTIAVVGEDIVFTPAEGFYGEYEATYEVCETPGGLCATATVTFLVNGPGSANTTAAADDFINTAHNVPATGNVKTNDTDAEGDAQTVTPQTATVVAGKGILDLASDGTFTFTPEFGFVGPVDFVYTICDDKGACANATLHVLVTDHPDLVPTLTVTPTNTTGTVPVNVVVEVSNIPGSTAATNGSEIKVYLTKDSRITLNYDPAAVSVGNATVHNSQWTFDNTDPDFYIFTTNAVIDGFDSRSFGLTGTLNPGATSGLLTVTTVIGEGSGGEIKSDNNSDAEAIRFYKN